MALKTLLFPPLENCFFATPSNLIYKIRANITKRLVLCLIVFLAIGCKTSILEDKDKSGGVLVFAATTVPTIIHPFLTFDSISVHIVPLVFNGLVKVAADGDLIPDLAESYKITQDGLEYNIVLKKGIKFHDGKELTNKDVKFTFEKIKAINKKATTRLFNYDFSSVKDIKLIDKYKIRITLKQPFAPFLYYLSVGILPEHVYQDRNSINDIVGWQPIGTGPFKLTKIDNKEIVLTRFDEYFKGRAHLDKIVCEIHPVSVLWAKLLKGEIDYARFVPAELLVEVKKVKFLKTYNMLEPSFYMLFLNCAKPLFKDKKVRQALNRAINKDVIIKKALNSRGIICNSPFLPNNWVYNNKLKPYEYNPQQSLKELKEIGWIINEQDGLLYKAGVPFKFSCVLLGGYPNILNPAILIQRQLSEIGIKMELAIIHDLDDFWLNPHDPKQNLSLQTNTSKTNDHWDAYFGRIESIPEPDKNYFYFHSSRSGTTNFLNYRNPKIDQLLETGRTTIDKDKRRKIYIEFQNNLYNDPPGIFVFYKYTSIAVHKRFKNAFPDDLEVFRGIEHWYVDKKWENPVI